MNGCFGRQCVLGRRLRAVFIAAILFNPIGCGDEADSSSGTMSTENTRSTGGATSIGDATSTMPNVQPVRLYVGPNGPSRPSANLLYTDVTICVPGTSNCQTLSDIQVDTGSSGLRILASEVTLPLPNVNDTLGNPLGECVMFADTSYSWGPVVSADIQLASEKATSVPIQLIGTSSFPSAPASCGATGLASDSVAVLGARGILGVSIFRQDCGTSCESAAGSMPPPDMYFKCPSATSSCTATTVPLESQLQNPVWCFSEDNNGLLISLPAIPEQGAAMVSGSLIFGIGTRTNNALGEASIYTTDEAGHFSTVFNGVTYTGPSGSYIDSGSNLLLFPPPVTTALPNCTNATSFFCPATTQAFTATNLGINGTSGTVSFSVANALSLFETGNAAFNNLAGAMPGGFDWGLPFFFGRKVFVAIEGQTTPGGSAPYWAY